MSSSGSCKVDLRAIPQAVQPLDDDIRDVGERSLGSETEGFDGVNRLREGSNGVDHGGRLDLGFGELRNEELVREKGLDERGCCDRGDMGLVDDADSVRLGFSMAIDDDAEVSRPRPNSDCRGFDVVDDAEVNLSMRTGGEHCNENDGVGSGLVMDVDAKELVRQREDGIGDFDAKDANVNLYVGIDENEMEDGVAFEAGLSRERDRYRGINLFVELNGSSIDEEIMVKSRPGVDNMVPFKNGSGRSMGSGTRFGVGDIVWGKVMSHPWWPGQIIDPSAAPEKAKKYFKKNSYLVMYFGDQSFAWNEVSHIKPFREHFSQLEKQSNLGSFRYAVDCALEEVARRLENGLSCSCTSEGVPSRIKRQNIVNVSIGGETMRKEFVSSVWGVAMFDSVKVVEVVKKLAGFSVVGGNMLEFVELKASLLAFARWKNHSQLPVLEILSGSFKPVKLVECVKELARSLPVHIDMIRFVQLKASLSAFARWKGHSRLSVFDIYDGSLDNISDVRIMGEEESSGKCNQSVSLNLCDQESILDQMVTGDKFNSRKHNDDSDDDLYAFRKEKRLSDLMSNDLSCKSTSKRKIRRKSLSLLSGHKPDALNSNIVKVKSGRSQSLQGTITSTRPTQFDGGGQIDNPEQVASRMIRSKPSCLRGNNRVIGKRRDKNKLLQAGHTYLKLELSSPQGRKLMLEQSSSVKILSQLRMTARNPTEWKRFSASLQMFISEFRNSFIVDHCSLLTEEKKASEVLSSSEGVKDISSLDGSEPPEDQFITDSYWTDRLIQVIPGMQNDIRTSDEGLSLNGSQGEEGTCLYPVEVGLADHFIHNFDSNYEPITKKNLNDVDNGVSEETDHTALILNFTNLDSIPSKSHLNEIFGCYGPLVKSETKIFHSRKGNRAKVLFKRRADAETAFSSAGKYSIFGPSLISYQLKYGPFPRQESSSHEKKRKRGA